MKHSCLLSVSVGVSLVSAGCAFDLVQVKQSSALLQPATTRHSSWVLAEDVKVTIGTSYPTRLKAGTRWQAMGRLEQGDVYETSDQVVTVEASNIHEAWLVVRDGMATGFYLPVEKTFTPAKPPKPIQTKDH